MLGVFSSQYPGVREGKEAVRIKKIKTITLQQVDEIS
jgi:hypothetical protein